MKLLTPEQFSDVFCVVRDVLSVLGNDEILLHTTGHADLHGHNVRPMFVEAAMQF